MKKLYTTAKWKERSRRASLRELRKRQRRKRILGKRRRLQLGVPRTPARRRQLQVTLSAPESFSLIHNPAESVEFLYRISEVFRSRRDVYVDLSGVTELTSDAIVVLLSNLTDLRFSHGMRFSGNDPKAESPRRLLGQSGFFTFVASHELREPPEEGRIRRRSSAFVEANVADELVAFATERMLGRVEHRRSAQMTLVECMANTHEHSARQSGVNSWWATVYCPRDRAKACFTIVDNGVGIFKSVTIKNFRRRTSRALGLTSNAEVLRDWLEGRIAPPARTGEPNRGKGLLAIYKRFQRRKDGMSNLIIIANDVYANLTENRFETLPVPFSGTIVYWETLA